MMPGSKEQIRTGTGYVIKYLNCAVPELECCKLCEKVLMGAISDLIETTWIFRDKGTQA
jgi:hypothetical protein